ncbi:transcription repressor NadR [Candidatus Enterococcus ferrettii]|uniref:Transcriptional regulator n=1 Tax=Candidatus Enterococcus ferrettii TaxID=2815324 RepID=A0ABV0ELH6_9ENTE|nr:transcription repressor NadR [Enterococcus sp. 665A]MBO1340029.1 transcription repressor NadR [Enterococcus sp. 665A]
MKDGNKRRKAILKELGETENPLSASSFAKKYEVSRQIIVGDVALLRAAGENIIATSRGYLLERRSSQLFSKIAVQHNKSQAEEELRTIVEAGGEVVDVIVEHPLYGELVGGLHITTQEDVNGFLENYQTSNASFLSELTDGIHLHTIAYDTQEDFERITEALSDKGILYKE